MSNFTNHTIQLKSYDNNRKITCSGLVQEFVLGVLPQNAMEVKTWKVEGFEAQKLRDCCYKKDIKLYQNILKSFMQEHECVEEQEYYNLLEETEVK